MKLIQSLLESSTLPPLPPKTRWHYKAPYYQWFPFAVMQDLVHAATESEWDFESELMDHVNTAADDYVDMGGSSAGPEGARKIVDDGEMLGFLHLQSISKPDMKTVHAVLKTYLNVLWHNHVAFNDHPAHGYTMYDAYFLFSEKK